MTNLSGALRRLAIELAQRDIPFRHVQQAFRAVAEDVKGEAPLDHEELLPWAERVTKPLLVVIGGELAKGGVCRDCKRWWTRRGVCTAIPAENFSDYDDNHGPGRAWREPDVIAPPWCPGFEAREEIDP